MTAFESVDKLFGNRESKVARDLKLNLKNLISKSSLTPTEAGLLLVGLSQTVRLQTLRELGLTLIKEGGESLSEPQIQEAIESSAMMGMLNAYYRFRHFLDADGIQNPAYQTAGLRMTALASPELGKPRFELLALAHSVVNGCQKCVTSHEKSLVELGVSPEKIHDAARLASVTNGLRFLFSDV